MARFPAHWKRSITARPLISAVDRPAARTGRDAPSEGEKIGDYLLVKEIARGGMGVVYEAEQVSLGRKVALKMILTGAMASLTERERFRREARLAAKLNHRNIVPIVSVHDQDGILFFR